MRQDIYDGIVTFSTATGHSIQLSRAYFLALVVDHGFLQACRHQRVAKGIRVDQHLELPQFLEPQLLFSTKYFTQDVGIWIDAIDEIEEWVGSFCSEEALVI